MRDKGNIEETELIAVLLRVGCLGGWLILIPQMCSTNSLDASVLSTTFTIPSNFICNMSHLQASPGTHNNNNAHDIGHFFPCEIWYCKVRNLKDDGASHLRLLTSFR